MVQVDKTQQQFHTRNKGQGTTAPLTCTVINNPMFNVQTTPTGSTTASSSRATTPVKVEAACQYTKLTPEARAELARIGACFYCREPGHMASQCPCRKAWVAALTPVPETLTPAPAYVPTESTPASQDF